MTDRLVVLILCLTLGGAATTCGDQPQSTGKPSPTFEADIQPLFAQRCGKCHSQRVRKAGLDLSSMAGIHHGGESGESLVADSVEDSMLWWLIDEGEMPPPDEPALTTEQRELIRDWIAAGVPSDHAHPMSAESLNQHDVLPMLLLRCTTCHGPRRRDGGLDLRSRAAMLQGGDSGPALFPGDPDGSLMIQRIEQELCPPSDLLLKFFVRRPPTSEVQTLKDWISAGAPVEDIAPDVATEQPDLLVVDADRQHWAFQPPTDPATGASIDDFVGDRLRAAGLSFSPEASRETLIRRVYLDLIGMPPRPEQLRHWQTCGDENWYSSMVDQLLASPHYGERWGRYWLDLAGYADSEGGISADPIRPVAWKYRDYVIQSFNEDKPYDRFLLEQIAGDELVDYQNADVVTDQMVENLVATGFLRMGIDETGSRTMNFVPERLKVISDAITVVSSGLMGLTMECARCHSHKYDPIPHRDYYRFKAIFQGALDEHDWDSFKTRTLDLATPEHRRRIKRVNPPLKSELKKLQSTQDKATRQLRLELLRHHYPDQPEDDHQATLAALRVADNNRTLKQKRLVERLQQAELEPDAEQPAVVQATRDQIAALQREIDLVRRRMVPEPTIRALWDLGRPSPTYVLRGGEHNKPGDLVGPGVPSVLTDGKTPFQVTPPFPDGTPKTGRRLAFANWLTDPTHPLTARVMVNRIWYHHFGTGLVKDLENFGLQGEPPSHPELLDWLAIEFVRRGWSVKEMHRLILNSRTFRQRSETTQRQQRIDPQNRLLSRMPLRRMDAETLRDSLLAVAGRLDFAAGGLPDTIQVDRDGLVSVNPTEGGGFRRSVYLQYRRTQIPTMMDTFDYPQMGPNCIARTVSIVSPQSLMLMNNEDVRELAEDFAARVQLLAGGDDSATAAAIVDAAYRIALSRRPSRDELSLSTEALRQLRSDWKGDSQKALETYCHALLNSAAFLYID
ncbi:DUF1553 domain-containing protein [Roseiconus nitratireducens]|uniref:DUF1553 domain-containing protein n=1 Tax=Roseiconus nitratireducens TaxID=2605748 RepID=A0A5M6D6D7_9BACT|nr:PSD1 and planctomycete cytochrome C domain-containing protein [Roseiconus nitratireducens]KAA5543051.1 DUF1553 domain-containing protein [Roseiconus nitratireducens]